jgi:hypothetical protein
MIGDGTDHLIKTRDKRGPETRNKDEKQETETRERGKRTIDKEQRHET